MKCDNSSGVGRRVRTARYAASIALWSSGASCAIWVAALKKPSLIRSADLAVHEQQPLGNRAAARVELVLAGVAVPLDEVVAAGVGRPAG